MLTDRCTRYIIKGAIKEGGGAKENQGPRKKLLDVSFRRQRKYGKKGKKRGTFHNDGHALPLRVKDMLPKRGKAEWEDGGQKALKKSELGKLKKLQAILRGRDGKWGKRTDPIAATSLDKRDRRWGGGNGMSIFTLDVMGKRDGKQKARLDILIYG